MMISSFRIANFKSFVAADVHLAPLTFLVGPNASGKSNALEALRLLRWLSQGMRPEDIERSIHGGEHPVRGRVPDLFRNDTKTLSLCCCLEEDESQGYKLELAFRLSSNRLFPAGESIRDIHDATLLYRVEDKDAEHTDVFHVLYNTFDLQRGMARISCSSEQALFYHLDTPGMFAGRDLQAQDVIPKVAGLFRERLRNIFFFSPNPSAMRGYALAGDEELKEDGSNLSSILARLCERDENKQALLSFVRSLPEQDITDISFITTERNDVMVRLHESFGNREQITDAPLLSDGILRVLGLGALLLCAPQGSLISIENADSCIHPSCARLLVQQIRDTASRRGLKVLISSHNPAFLDAIPGKALGDVLCCYRDPDKGDSRIVRLKDIQRLPELLAQGTLGWLVTSNKLDNFLKNPMSEEERIKAGLAWLDRLVRESEIRESEETHS